MKSIKQDMTIYKYNMKVSKYYNTDTHEWSINNRKIFDIPNIKTINTISKTKYEYIVDYDTDIEKNIIEYFQI